MSQMPPSELGSTLTDFVNYAKFQLSLAKSVLMEDPIWDRYTDEGILVEYYANLYTTSKDELKKFEGEIVDEEDFASWADGQIEENQKELVGTLDSAEDSIRFSPDSLGDS